MSHILIQNRKEVPIWGIRLLGLSDKSSNKIGRFGTGLKETLALLARYDRLPTIFSGETRIDFEVQTVDEQSEICFRLSADRDRFRAGEWYGLGIHPNFGKADWNDRWMAIRELLCNAQDEDGIYHEVISTEPCGVAGATRVYLRLDTEMLAAYSAAHERLLFLKDRPTVQAVVGLGRVLAKGNDPKLQVFHHGVWIQAGQKNSLYDYELNHVQLNECRSADWWDVNYEIAKIMACYHVVQAATLLGRRGEETYEKTLLSLAADLVEREDNSWKTAFMSLYGEQAVATTDDAHTYDQLKKMGWTPIIVADCNLLHLLTKAGVQTFATTLSQQEKDFESTSPPNEAQRATFDGVWRRLREKGLTGNKDQPAMMLFRQNPAVPDFLLGQYAENTCYINEACIGSEHERETCIEEIAHHVTEAADYSRQLQTYLITAIGKLL
jgi:hypothetical protein